MSLRHRLLGGTSHGAIIWYEWRQPQFIYVRPVRNEELLAETGGVLTHGVWRERDGLLCLAASLEDANTAALNWAESWHTVVLCH